MSISHYIWAIILLFITQQSFAFKPFSKEVWLNETNTPVEVNCIVMANDGIIWMGTSDGLYWYDGIEAHYLHTYDNVSVTALKTTKQKLYIGFENGTMGTVDNEKFYPWKYSGKSPKTSINSIETLPGNTLILSTAGEGIFLVNHNFSYRFTLAHGLTDEYIYTTVFPDSITTLTATDRGINQVTLNKKDPIAVRSFTMSDGLSDNIVRVIKPMPDKCFSWIGTHQGGLSLYCSQREEIWSPKVEGGWRWGQINDILPAGKDTAWVCTESGYLLKVILKDSNNIQIEQYHYPGKKLNKIIADGTGNIWCATNTGLMMLTVDYISAIELEAPFQLSKITALACDNQKNIFLAIEHKLYKLNHTNTTQLELHGKLPSSITSMMVDSNGTIWLGTFGHGIWKRTTTGNIMKFDGIPILQSESVLDMAIQHNKLWVAGLNGVQELSIHHNTLELIQTHNKHTGIGSDYVYSLYTDKKNNIWMGTDGAGICCYHSGKYRHWDSSSGMVADVVYSISEDHDGNLWASTLEHGLLKYNGNNWSKYNQEDGLKDLNISTINTNNTGQVFAVHALGIDVWYPQLKQFRHFDKKMNLGIDSVSKELNLSAKDNSGNVYIPYNNGLICFHNVHTTQQLLPAISIRSVSAFFKEVPLYTKQFTHANNHISFGYRSVNYANPQQIYFRYKLEGYNDSWITTADRTVTFPKLPSGDYNFIVQSSANPLFSNTRQATYSFTIQRPFWLHPLFLILVAAITWLIVYTYVRLRERNFRKLSSLQRERMLFEYEHLKSQVNPHFLFNSLNTLTNIIEDDKEAAIAYTGQLSDLYRNMLSYRNKDLISLQEEWEIIENYLYIQETRFGNAITIKVDLPEQIMKTKKVVPMAIQLLVENAIKHNVVSKSKPLNITIEADNNYITVQNTYQPKISKEKGAGLGLSNIRKRYSLLTKKSVSYYIQDDYFNVKLPLI